MDPIEEECSSISKGEINENTSPEVADVAISKDEELECAVCLQTCIHPVQLPCTHIFCFLCVKGVANQSKRCAMCRQEIPADFLENPTLLKKVDEETKGVVEEYQWFYGGRNGWWQYDERTSRELEAAYNTGQRSCEILVAGFLYTIDFDKMMQQRRNDPSRRRRIKRDLSSIPKKGVAGIKTDHDQENSAVETPSPPSETDCPGEASRLVDSGTTPSTSQSLPESLSQPQLSSNSPESSELEQVHLLHSHLYRNNTNIRPSRSSTRTRQGPYTTFNCLPPLFDVDEILESEYNDEEQRHTTLEQESDDLEVDNLVSHLRSFSLEQGAQFYSLDDTEEYDLPQ